MLRDALAFPLRERRGRDALAACLVLVLAAVLVLRVARALWPAAWALAVGALVVVPGVLFCGQVVAVLRASADRTEPPGVVAAMRGVAGVRAAGLAVAYLSIPVAVLTVTVAGVRGLSDVSGPGSLMVLAGSTASLLLAVSFAYVLPAAQVAAARDGVRAGVAVRSLRGTLSGGAYFAAWVAGATLAVLGWGALASAAFAGGVAVVVASAWFAYVHLVAASLLGEGVARTE